MCSAHPKYLTPRLSRAAAEILLYPLNMNPAPLPWRCRPWAPGTSTGNVTWTAGVLQSSEQPALHTELALHSFQFFLHTLQFLGQLIACRLARAGCKCDAGSFNPPCPQQSHSTAHPLEEHCSPSNTPSSTPWGPLSGHIHHRSGAWQRSCCSEHGPAPMGNKNAFGCLQPQSEEP